jgi:hypothetical protein
MLSLAVSMIGRLNSSIARRCDDCDESRSLDFSMDYFVDRGPPPPPYLAWWKPPSNYFPPRGEAPPPYEEAIASTSNCLPMTFTAAYANANASSVTVTPVISSNGIATTSLIITPATVSECSPQPARGSSSSSTTTANSAEVITREASSSSSGSNKNGQKSKKRNFRAISSTASSSSEPQPGPSCTRRRLNENGFPQQHLSSMPAVPPAYDDSIMQVPPTYGRDHQQCFRHSLSLPRRGGGSEIDHPFCPRIGTAAGGSNVGGGSGPNQRYSLQFHIADHCWSSASSSTLSLSTPNSPNGHNVRPPSLSSSSSSNVSNTNV